MKVLTMALTAALALAGAAFASNTDTVTARFPTPVLVGGKVLPAGDATINILRGSSDYLILTVRAQDGEAAGVVATRVSDPDETAGARVVFGKRGNVLKLERVWLDNGTGFAIAPDLQ